MKKIKSILNIKLLLAIALMGVSTLAFSQTSNVDFNSEEHLKEVKFDFMGIDLSTQSPPQLHDLNNLSGGRQSPQLKSAFFNHFRLDSMHDLTNYGDYIEHSTWYYNYNENNILATSERRFLDASTEYRDKKEIRKYNIDGQITNVLRTEYSFTFNTLPTTYREDNEYANGNLIYQFKVESYFNNVPAGTTSVYTTTRFSYNEKNQLVKAKISSSLTGVTSTIEYFYDEEGRQKYTIEVERSTIRVNKYDYLFSDTTQLIIQKQLLATSKPQTLSDLEKYNDWPIIITFTLHFDQYGRTKSIEKISTNTNRPNQGLIYIFKAEYDYTASGKQKLATFYLPKDRYDPETYYISTIEKSTYDEQDNLVKYEKMFYDSVINEWVHEEIKTYYYSSIKTELTSNNQHKTDNFHIYPNPASDVINLSASPEPGSSYTIFNLMGEVVSQGMLKSQSIPISLLKPGSYFIKIVGDKSASSYKFIKK